MDKVIRSLYLIEYSSVVNLNIVFFAGMKRFMFQENIDACNFINKYRTFEVRDE